MKAAGSHRSKKKSGIAEQAVERIKELYAVEHETKLDPDAIVRLRQEKSAPVIAAMHAWLLERFHEVPPQSLLGKAIAYALGQ